jgi:hypothetical protein
MVQKIVEMDEKVNLNTQFEGDEGVVQLFY